MYELCHKKTPYWFTNAEVDRIQKCNLPFFKVDDFESMLKSCFRVPEDNGNGRMAHLFGCFRGSARKISDADKQSEHQDSHRPVAQTPGLQDEAYQEGAGLSACKNLKI